MAEVHEHHHHDSEGSSLATIATIVIALLVLGFLLWNFLPVRDGSNTIDVNLNPGGTGQAQ